MNLFEFINNVRKDTSLNIYIYIPHSYCIGDQHSIMGGWDLDINIKVSNSHNLMLVANAMQI